jgi:glycolate oxidase iron-sulfur subunit
VREEPRAVLAAIETEQVLLPESESCCGSAGLYSSLRPDDSRAILGPRLDALVASGARTLVTGNPGCHLQWTSGVAERGLGMEVLHIAELLERALDAGAQPSNA